MSCSCDCGCQVDDEISDEGDLCGDCATGTHKTGYTDPDRRPPGRRVKPPAGFTVGRDGEGQFTVECSDCWAKPVLSPYRVSAARVARFIEEHECRREDDEDD